MIPEEIAALATTLEHLELGGNKLQARDAGIFGPGLLGCSFSLCLSVSLCFSMCFWASVCLSVSV